MVFFHTLIFSQNACFFILFSISVRENQRRSVFLNDLQAFYPTPFLEQIHLSIDPRLNTPWPLKIGKVEGRLHPVCYLVIFHFLGFGVQEILLQSPELKLFGEGPWPCLNPVCQHFHQFVITKCEAHISNKGNIHSGIFECSCGMVYARYKSREENDDIFRLDKIIVYGHIWQNELICLFNKGISNQEISKRLGICDHTLIKILADLELLTVRGDHLNIARTNNLPQKVKDERQIDEYRKIWLAVIHAFPNMTQNELCKGLKFERVYRWLRRFDKEWLENHQPAKAFTDYENQKYARKIRWIQKDIYFAQTIFSAARELLNNSVIPARFRVYELLKPLGKKNLFTEERENLAITMSIIDTGVESNEFFLSRQIDWVYRTSNCNSLTKLKSLSKSNNAFKYFKEYDAEKIWDAIHSPETDLPLQLYKLTSTALTNWEELDNELSKKVIESLQAIMEINDYPRRITFATIGYYCNQLHQFIFHLDRLPHTQAEIVNHIESDEEYIKRILTWAKEFFTNRGYCPKFDAFCRFLGLTQFQKETTLDLLVNETISEIHRAIRASYLENFSLEKIDILFYEAISQAVDSIQNGLSSPKQITLTQIRIYLEINASHLFPYWKIFIKYTDSLPKTTNLLDQTIELKADFIKRKILWAADKFREKGICPTKAQLLRYSTVESYTEEWIDDIVHDIQESLSIYPSTKSKGLQNYWEEQDNKLVDLVNPIAEELKAQSFPFKQITKEGIINLINKEVDFRVYNNLYHLGKLPRTKTALEREVETFEDFVKRKVEVAFDLYQQRSVCPTLKNFKKTASLVEAYKYDWCNTLVQDAIKKLSIFPKENDPVKIRKKYWEEFDSEMVIKAEKIIAYLLELRPLKRVTCYQIGIFAKYQHLSMVIREGKLPKTKVLLDKYTETPEEFAWRRLNHAVDHYKKLGVCPTKKQLIEFASLRTFKNLPQFEEAIRNATKASN